MSADPPPTQGGGTEIGVATERVAASRVAEPRDWLRIAGKAASGVAALFLFVLALQLMKEGARAIGPAFENGRLFGNAVSTLGAGWLGAYVVLSGSPIAALALSLNVGGALNELQTFTMLSGSRLGASFVVLLVGFLYTLRNRGANRGEATGIGILALNLTAIVYLPGMLIGYWILKTGMLDQIRWSASNGLQSVVDYVWGPLLDLITALPGWTLLPIGLGVILVSFKLLDRVLPQLDGERRGGPRAERLRRPWPMFFLGCLVATLTLSVSVALTLLVPLASRGYVKPRETVPYIMGANITTLADTLVAAMVLGSSVAVQIVLAQALAVALVTILYLAVLYRPIVNGVMRLDEWLVSSGTRLTAFVIGTFVFPLLLMLAGLAIGPVAR